MHCLVQNAGLLLLICFLNHSAQHWLIYTFHLILYTSNYYYRFRLNGKLGSDYLQTTVLICWKPGQLEKIFRCCIISWSWGGRFLLWQLSDNSMYKFSSLWETTTEKNGKIDSGNGWLPWLYSVLTGDYFITMCIEPWPCKA